MTPTDGPAAFDDLEHLRPVLDAVPDPMLVVDQDGVIRCFNEPARRLLGYEHGIEGRAVEELIPPHLAEAHQRHRAEYARLPRRRPMGSGMELWARRSDGVDIPVEVSLSPVDIAGQHFVMASIRDTGPQRRARDIQLRLHQQETLMTLWEQALREGATPASLRNAAQSLHELFAARRVRLYEIDGDSGPVRVRALADTRVGGRSSWVELGDVPDVATMFEAEAEAAHHGVAPVAARLHHRVGEVLLVLSLRSQGQMVGALLVSLPSGATFTRDQVYQAQNVAHLLASVLARSRADQMLLVAAKMEALGQLSGGIAHDFNNLLSIIAGNLEVLGDRIGHDATVRRMLDTALATTRRGGELTRRLLLFARKRPLIPGPQRLPPLLKEIAEVLERTLGKAVDLQLQIEDDLPPVQVDPAALDACLINLATNARDAMPAGGRLDIRAGRRRLETAPRGGGAAVFEPADFVAIEVEDAGEGMSEDIARRAFEPFFTTKASGQGTGLGLSLVRSLIAQGGGHVDMISHPGDGTTVILYLPLAERAPEIGAATENVEPRGRGQRVLVVEDEPAVRDTVCMMLEGLGYRTLSVGSVDAAVSTLMQIRDIAVVLSDVVLEGHGSGLELQQRLRISHPQLPVVLTSGYARTMLERYGMDPRQTRVLAKPYTRMQLARAIAEVLTPDQAAED